MNKGQKMSDEQRLKISLSKQGKGNHRLGTKHSEETKAKMRFAAQGRDVSHLNWTGRSHTAESRKKISEANKKRAAEGNHPMLGFKFSQESKLKMRKSHLGQKVSEETRKKLSASHKGSLHWNWQGGITPENKKSRQSKEWKDWRNLVFKRDRYTCQECLCLGGKLEAHHIIPVREDKSKLFASENGITLCRTCHIKTIWKESSFVEKYSAIVAAQGN